MSLDKKSLGIMVKDIMTTNVIFIKEDDPISFVYNILERCHISGAPVVNSNEEFVGVISKTDLIESKMVKNITEGKPLESIPVKQIMKASALIAVDESAMVEEAVSKMDEYKVHRVFVKNLHGKIIGIVSASDIVKLLAHRRESCEASHNSHSNSKFSNLQSIIERKHNESWGSKSF